MHGDYPHLSVNVATVIIGNLDVKQPNKHDFGVYQRSKH